jgi:hypothetical protein
MEAYVFADIGAWRSIEELEDSLILNELILLVSACRRSDFKNLKMMAMGQGADVTLEDEDYGFEIGSSSGGKDAISGFEATHLPIGVGYVEEKAEEEEVAEPTKMGVAELIESRIAESEAQYIKTDDEDD